MESGTDNKNSDIFFLLVLNGLSANSVHSRKANPRYEVRDKKVLRVRVSGARVGGVDKVAGRDNRVLSE